MAAVSLPSFRKLLTASALVMLSALRFAAPAADLSALVPPTAVTPDYRCWHNVVYGPRSNYADEGAGFQGPIGNWGVANVKWRQATHKTAQHFDLYAPVDGTPEKATVVVYLHGGAWSQPFDKDSIPSALRTALLSRKAVVCSVGYMLQTDLTINPTTRLRPEATFEVMVRDIDAALGKLKGVLPRIGVKSVDRLVLMGESAGAHLALVYAYDQGNPQALGLGLRHAFRVDKAIAVACPVDFVELDGNTDKPTSAYDKDSLQWKFRMTLRRCLGIPDEASDARFWPLARKWSPVTLVSERSVPTVIVNGQLFPLVYTDGAIPLGQKKLLEKALDAKGVPHDGKVFLGNNHADLIVDAAPWIADKCLN